MHRQSPPENHNACPDVTKSGSQHGGPDASPAYPVFLPSDLSSRKRLAQPSLTVCRPLPIASASSGTSLGMAEPEPTKAPSPILTGATSAEFEPMKAPLPMSVRCLAAP